MPDVLMATNMVIPEVLDLMSSGTSILFSGKEAKEGNTCCERNLYPVYSLMEQSNPDWGPRG